MRHFNVPEVVDEKCFFIDLGKAEAIYMMLQGSNPADLPGRNPYVIIRHMTDLLVEPQRKRWIAYVHCRCKALVARNSNAKQFPSGFLVDVQGIGWDFEWAYRWLMEDAANDKVDRQALSAIWNG